MNYPRLATWVAVAIAVAAGSPTLAADRVNWTSVQGLFPGPKPERGTLSPEDVAPWKSQAAREGGLNGIGYGDEKPWSFQGRPVTIVALQIPLAVGCKFGPPGFVVGLLDGGSKLLARNGQLYAEGSDTTSTRKAYHIDTAPYRISETETAFGLRIDHYNGEKHWCYADQVLHLFRVVGKDVVRILATDAFYEQLDQVELSKQDTEEAMNQLVDDPDCSFSYDKAFPPKGRGAVFRMLPSKSQGFYDIQRTRKGAPAATFRWDGQWYVMDGQDPLDHHVREEWDSCTGRRYLDYHGLPAPTPAKADKAQAKPAAPAVQGAGKR